MRPINLPLAAVTDTSGDGASAVVGVPGGAFVEAIDYYPGTITSDTGTTIVVTDEYNGASYTLFSLANPGTSNIRRYPRVLEQLNSDGSNLTSHTRQIVMGALKFTVSGAAGGAGQTGSVTVHLSDS